VHVVCVFATKNYIFSTGSTNVYFKWLPVYRWDGLLSGNQKKNVEILHELNAFVSTITKSKEKTLSTNISELPCSILDVAKIWEIYYCIKHILYTSNVLTNIDQSIKQ